MGIINFFKSLKRKREAKRDGVPYKERMWYNYRAMLSKASLTEESFIEIFDADGSYINCPGIGGTVMIYKREYPVLQVGDESATYSHFVKLSSGPRYTL